MQVNVQRNQLRYADRGHYQRSTQDFSKARAKQVRENSLQDRVDLRPKPNHAEGSAVDSGDHSFSSSDSYYNATADSAKRTQYYGGGAEVFSGQNPQALFDNLSDLLTRTHKPLDYEPDDYLYPVVDRHPDGSLYCVYSGEGPMFFGDSQAGHAMKSGFNCEHVVPQSWFGKKSAPRGDLHHLFACEQDCNSIRSSALFDEFKYSGPTTDTYQVIHHGVTNLKTNHFSPESGKGEVARATLYFLMRYPGQVGDRSNEYSAKDLPLLVKWANEDPPTDYERHRNAEIQKLQGNRNPLVDFPDLVNKIDFARGLGVPRRR